MSKKKSRFDISREVQEEFVNSIAEHMFALSNEAGKWQKPWYEQAPMGMPFCVTTGREYSGSNMVKLMLASVLKGYNDDRWMTFKQLESVQVANPDLKMHIRKGEKGVKLLRPQIVHYIEDEDGKWKFLSDKQLEKIKEDKENGLETPEVQKLALYYPFTVFNAAQVEGFPKKEHETTVLSVVERNALVEDFIACSGVPVLHGGDEAHFNPHENLVRMPLPQHFSSTDEYYAAKLHEFYHATGHESRENRKDSLDAGKNYALEEIRAEMFSMLVGARFNLPMPEQNSAAYIKHWNQKFSGGDVKTVMHAATEAAKMLALMHQYETGEQPAAQWFPRREDWPYLLDTQKERDAQSGVELVKVVKQEQENKLQEKLENIVQDNLQDNLQDVPQAAPSDDTGKVAAKSIDPHMPRAAPPTFDESAAAFMKADNPILQFRAILQNPAFIDMALQGGSDEARSLAQLCDAFSTTLHMELDARKELQREFETPAPVRMRA